MESVRKVIFLKTLVYQKTGSTTPVLPKPVLVTGFRYRNRVLPEPVLPEILKGSVWSLSYRIGTGLDRTGTGSYQLIVYR
ncbi:hypothetical protein H5410_013921 [Solanum commersonii]|uniref:Uncharacterized protein n=1 Tax=Solanum commersonii TaxID=4109 RepID=A0A9J5ZPJ7_SOLCO|nr:hypothetical protein H5410_013921 [Solanum commersonii]